VPYVPVKQRKQQMVPGWRGPAAGSGPPAGPGPLTPLSLSCRSCCRCGGRWCRRRSSATAGASSGATKTTSRWGRSPTSASWTSTSTSRRRRKVGGRLSGGRAAFGGGRNLLALPLTLPTARKESAKEKQLKEEEKILESVAEGRGEWWDLPASRSRPQSCWGSGRGVARLAALGDVHTPGPAASIQLPGAALTVLRRGLGTAGCRPWWSCAQRGCQGGCVSVSGHGPPNRFPE